MLAMLAAAEGLILRPPHAEAIAKGTTVPVMELRELAEGL